MSFKLDKKAKSKWVKALTSGKYKQGSGKLYCGLKGGYCCLGVACEINLTSQKGHDEFVKESFLPEEIQLALAALNDHGVPFDMIAGLIDETL